MFRPVHRKSGHVGTKVSNVKCQQEVPSDSEHVYKFEYLDTVSVCLCSQPGHVAPTVYICSRGHAGRYLTVIDEQGNEGVGGSGGGKIGKESRLSPVIN